MAMGLDEVRLPGFAGRTAIVTGGARGIGAVIARALLNQGANVGVLDLLSPEESALPRDRGLAVSCDVTDASSVDAAFSAVEDRFGAVTILVNNAGILLTSSVESTTLEDWEKSLAVNLTGPFLCVRRALPAMRREGYGRIMSIGSSAGKTGGSREMGAYAASKAGLMAFARSVASEYASEGITSNALAPTLIETDMIAGLADLAERIPVGRLGQPEDVAFAVLTLTSETAGYITGEVTDVNGGFLID